MLPPADPAVLASNPKFGALYQDLCSNKLNANGSSKIHDAKVLKEREAFAEDLRKARVEVASRELVASGLKELSYGDNELPQDLRELVAVIAAVLEGQIAEEDNDLLQDDIAKFKTNVGAIAAALFNHFKEDITSISTVLDPDGPPPAQYLLPEIFRLKASLSTSEAQLNASRLQVATEAAKVHTLNRQATQQSIAMLEQTIHGSVSRASKAKAEYLATVAEGMSKKLSLQQKQLNSQLYSPEVQEALRAKTEGLEGSLRATRRKIREAEERLEGYRRVGGMEGVAREYAEVLAETERVQGEIERLKGGGGG